MDGGLSIKENRLYRRTHFTEKLKFGYDKPLHIGISDNLSPGGMNIISDKALVPLSNIIINIYVKHTTTENDESWEDITVAGIVIWVLTPPGIYSKMGIRFKESYEELVRIYAAKKPR